MSSLKKLSCLLIAVLTTAVASANPPGDYLVETVNGQQVHFLRIAKLESAEANVEFQQNVNILQNLRNRAAGIAQALQEETDPEKKATLQEQAQQALDLVNENNKKMFEAYGYTLNRNYMLKVERAHAYLQLNEEEVAKLDRNDPELPDIMVREQDGQEILFMQIATFDNVEAYEEFQRNVDTMQTLRMIVIRKQEALEQESDEAKKAELAQQIEADIARLNENNQKMFEAYGYSLTRNYIMQLERSHIYLEVSEEEAERAQKLNAHTPVAEPVTKPVAQATAESPAEEEVEEKEEESEGLFSLNLFGGDDDEDEDDEDY